MTHQKRYTAEDFSEQALAESHAVVKLPHTAKMLSQAADTESRIEGLVHALENIATSHESELRSLPLWAREVLSKFRGEA